MSSGSEFRSGFIVFIGRPNVGKSTLLNKLARQKVAIVSDKPQTTRHQIRAIINQDDAQLILIDTPGFHKPKDGLGARLNQTVRSALGSADAALFLLDAASGVGSGDAYIARELKKVNTPVIVALNKIDLIDEAVLSAEKTKCKKLSKFNEVLLISGLTGAGLDELINKLISLLPPGPKYYPDNMLHDQPEKLIIAEFIREKILERTHEEVPYSVAVEIEEVKKVKDVLHIYGWIYVERDSQKGIIIGSGGAMLKEIGTRARVDLENLLGENIYLNLRVKVKKHWRRDGRLMDELGY